MGGVVADRVVVELEAKLDKYDANVRGAAATFSKATSDIEASAGGAENAHKRLTASVGNSRIAMLEFQHIARGTADQIASGAAPMQILAQHLGMLGQAVTLAGGTFGKFGAFLGGPWGLALTVAAAGVSTLIMRHHDEADTLETVLEKRRKHQHETELSEQADAVWSKTLEALIDRQKQLNEQLSHRLELQPVVDDQAYAAAQRSVVALGKALDDAENSPTVTPERLAKLHKAFSQAVREAYQYSLIVGQNEGAALADLSERSKQWADRQQDVINRLQGYHPELSKFGGDINAAFAVVKKAVTDAAGANVPFDSITNRIDELNNKFLESPTSVREYVTELRKLAAQLEKTTEAAKAAAKVDPIAAFKAGIIGAEGTGANKLGSSAAGFGQFMPSTFEGYFKRLYPDQASGLSNSQIDDFRNNKEVATAVIDAATKDYVAVLERAGQQITAASLYTVHVLGASDATKFFSASPNQTVSSALGGGKHAAAVLAGNPFLRGTVAEAQASFSKRIGSSDPAVSSGAVAIQRQLTEEADKWAKALAKGLSTEADVSDLMREQGSLSSQLRSGILSVNDAIKNDILPSVEAWDKEYEQIIGSTQELNRFGAQLIDDIFNPDNWDNWGDAGKHILKELELEFLQLAALNPLKNLLFGSQLPTLGGATKGSGLFGTIASIAASLFGKGLGKSLYPVVGGVDPLAPLSGRASGGNVRAGQIYQVNENGIEAFQPAQSGQIIPLGRMRGVRGNGGTTVIQHFTLDARYGITTPELLRHVNQVAATRAVQAGRGSFEASQKAMPGRFSKLQKLGT